MYQLVNSNSADRFSWDAEAEQAYWLAQEQKHIVAPVEISVGAFHEAAGRYLSINWMYCVDAQTDSESFMSAEMICGNVTDIYVRVGARYFQLCDRESCTHEYLLQRIAKEVHAKNTVVQM
ncbi:hypothetical protein [Hafnia alvei]|uniref:hypothetical protein n=1 Tax=Hafnia alvei TaxID=569 RepID=UPI0014131C0F|nr:hypothetical protein [Hafnia alvei]QIP58285.1 hypothetical protein HBA19_21705 [Hafnia alvei]